MPPMDLPPVQVEVVRLGLQGQPAQLLCRPDAGAQERSLSSSLSGSQACSRQASRIRIDEPPGWPVLPPPPLPR
jgi:hypothetical protein